MEDGLFYSSDTKLIKIDVVSRGASLSCRRGTNQNDDISRGWRLPEGYATVGACMRRPMSTDRCVERESPLT